MTGVAGVEIGLELVVALLALVVLGVLGIGVRRRTLQRSGGTFDCSFREKVGPHARGWMLCIARYDGDAISWFRVISLSPRPRRVVNRSDLEVVGRRQPHGQEAFSMMGGSVVVSCRERGRPLELGMSEPALTGFLAWLESAPPGQNVNVVA